MDIIFSDEMVCVTPPRLLLGPSASSHRCAINHPGVPPFIERNGLVLRSGDMYPSIHPSPWAHLEKNGSTAQRDLQQGRGASHGSPTYPPEFSSTLHSVQHTTFSARATPIDVGIPRRGSTFREGKTLPLIRPHRKVCGGV